MLGNRVLRTEDPRMLTEGARYVADLRFDGLAHACFVRSTVAHGRLAGVDTAEARSWPGVLGVFTAADLDLSDLPTIPVVNRSMARPVLARDTVRFVGEPVVAVVAETAAAAADAAEHVVVDIEPRSRGGGAARRGNRRHAGPRGRRHQHRLRHARHGPHHG